MPLILPFVSAKLFYMNELTPYLQKMTLAQIKNMIDTAPEVNSTDVGRFLLVSGMVLQSEAYRIVDSLQDIENHSTKLKRLSQVNNLLRTAGALMKDAVEVQNKAVGRPYHTATVSYCVDSAGQEGSGA